MEEDKVSFYFKIGFAILSLNTKVTAIIVIVVIVAVAGASLYVVSARLTASSITTSFVSSGTVTTDTSGNITSVDIISDNLTVGFQSGLWQLIIKNNGTVGVSVITVYLKTPTPSEICSAGSLDDGLSFFYCPSTAGNPLPPGTTAYGTASGVGEGSATVGSSYPVDCKVTYDNDVTAWSNFTVIATLPTS